MSRLPLFLLLLSAIGCSNEPAAPTLSPNHSAIKFWEAGAAVSWNGIARDLVALRSITPNPANRIYSLVGLAQYQAVVATEGASGGHPSPAGAVAGASAAVLAFFFPSDISIIEQKLAQQSAGGSWPGEQHTDFAAGEAIGRGAAEVVLARAATDRFNTPFTGTIPTGPGIWIPNGPPIGATLGQAKTFFLTSGDQFRPPRPPAFGSPEFLAALAEVRLISDTRTAEQEAIARFWAGPAGTPTPPGIWNEIAAGLIVQFHLREREAAHTFALMHMAAADALIACFDAKYTYWLIRPVQADPAIQPVFPTPNHPSYPSAHACISGAASTVLSAQFPSEKGELTALAEEGALSRLFAGIHYRFDNETGLTLGRRVGALALELDVHRHEPFELLP